MKTFVLGNNYLSTAFNPQFDHVETFTEFELNSIPTESVVINCLDNKSTNIRENWNDNYHAVWKLNKLAQDKNLKIIHISTADLYGNNMEWDDTHEECLSLDMNTDYRLSKRVAERMLDDQHIILRIKNPFDGRFHPDNWIVKNLQDKRLYHWIDSVTYIPDLLQVVDKFINSELSGIFNCVQFEARSSEHYFTNVLHIPNLSDYEICKDLSNEQVHADVNCAKIMKIINLSPVDNVIIHSYESILKMPEFINYNRNIAQ